LCEPATLSLIAGIGGTALSAVGAVQQGNAQADAARSQAAVDRNNAILAQRSAKDALQRSQAEEQAQQRKTAEALGRARAAFGSRGIEGDFGSPLATLGDIAQFGELDEKTIRTNAQREALGYEAQAMNFTSSASFKEKSAANYQTAGALSGLSTALNGGSSVAKSWYSMR
jgi:hypothetical protein